MSLDLQVAINVAGLPQLKQVDDGMSKAEQAAKKLSQGLESFGHKALEAFKNSIAITPESIMSGIEAVGRLADEYHEANDRIIELENSVQKFTGGMRTTNEVIEQQTRLANALHTTAAQVVEVYDAVGDATDSLNLSIQQQEALTIALGESAKLAGQSIQSVGGSLQGLGAAWETGGNVGKQLRSFLRDNHDLAIALSETLGMTSRQIIEAAENGSLTYGRFVDSVIKSEPKLHDTFGKIKKTHAESTAQFTEGFELSLRAGGDFADAMLDGMDRVDDEIKKSQPTWGEFFENLDRGFNKTIDDAHAMTAAWDAAKFRDSIWDKIPQLVTATGAAFKKLEEDGKKAAEAAKRFRDEMDRFNASLAEGRIKEAGRDIDAWRKSMTEAHHELELLDQSDAAKHEDRMIKQREREADMEREFALEANKIDAEATEKKLENAKKTQEAWATATGQMTGNFIKAALEGKKSFGEMTEEILRELALIVLKQAAVQMGGTYGAYFGAAVSAFGGGMTGFDYTVPNQAMALPGFATGGDFMVGGAGGVDRTLVAFRATPGETVHVRTPQQGPVGGGGGERPPVVVNVQRNRRDLLEGMSGPDGRAVFIKLDKELRRRGR